MGRDLHAVVAVAALSAGCLPSDTRPVPGELLVEVEESAVARSGFTTDDGWTLRFDRFVTALGGLGVGEGDDCIDYSLSFYDRLFDFTVAERSKLHLHYGLGTCELRYRLGSPSDDVILMGGVTDADRQRMRDPRLDELFGGALQEEESESEGGVGLWVVGAGVKDGVEVRFNWEIRTEVALNRCFVAEDVPLSVTLGEGATLVQSAEVRPRELFRRSPSRTAPFEFAPFASADADGDGAITLDELAAVPVDPEPIADDLADEVPSAPNGAQVVLFLGELNLERLLRSVLLPRVIAYDGVGECEFINGLELVDDD